MLLTIDLESEQPIYLQIRNSIVEGIANGDLKDGESLPSVRSLASELGINLHTVNKAYHILKLDGFVKILRSKGAIVNATGSSRDTNNFLEAATETLKNIVSEAVIRSIKRDQLIGIVNQLYNEIEGEN
jgi:DNA-binding transcriptional regulator YhcF (GntR family)